MKNLIFYIMFFFILFFLIVIISFKIKNDRADNYTIKDPIEYHNIVIKEEYIEEIDIWEFYAELPFTKILGDMGINFEWISNEKIVIFYNNQKYTLNLSNDINLVNHKTNTTIMLPSPGNYTFVCRIEDNEVIFDDNSVLNILNELRANIDVIINKDNKTALLSQRKTGDG